MMGIGECRYAYVWRDRFRQLPLLEAVSVDLAWSKGMPPAPVATFHA